MGDFTFCTSGAIIRKAGANVNSTIAASGAALLEFYNEAEGVANTVMRRDGTASFASMTANGKRIVSDIVSSLAAINMINYDMGGYTSRSEAQTMLDVNRDIAMRGISILKDDKFKKFLGL